MPIPLLAEGFGRGITNLPYIWTILKVLAGVALVYVLKSYFGGATCRAERVMHGKVVMVTVCQSLLPGGFSARENTNSIGLTRAPGRNVWDRV